MTPQPRAVNLQKRLGQRGDIFFVSAQRRQFDGHYAQAIEKIFAKFSIANRQEADCDALR